MMLFLRLFFFSKQIKVGKYIQTYIISRGFFKKNKLWFFSLLAFFFITNLVIFTYIYLISIHILLYYFIISFMFISFMYICLKKKHTYSGHLIVFNVFGFIFLVLYFWFTTPIIIFNFYSYCYFFVMFLKKIFFFLEETLFLSLFWFF